MTYFHNQGIIKVGKLKDDEKGFSALEIVLVIVIVLLIGLVGWFVYKSHSKTTTTPVATNLTPSKPTTSTSTKTVTATTTQPTEYYLDNKIVSYTLPSDWEVTNPPSNLTPPCGQSVTSVLPKCISEATLALKSEGFVNTDHFYATISVFPITNGTSAADFFNQTGNSGYSGSGSNLTINGNPAYSYAANPSQNSSEIWLYYTITKGQIGVLVFSDLFDGTHYSYTTTNNYLGYQNEVNAIANSISIN